MRLQFQLGRSVVFEENYSVVKSWFDQQACFEFEPSKVKLDMGDLKGGLEKKQTFHVPYCYIPMPRIVMILCPEKI